MKVEWTESLLIVLRKHECDYGGVSSQLQTYGVSLCGGSMRLLCSTKAGNANNLAASYLNLHLEKAKRLNFTSLKKWGEKSRGHQARCTETE